MARVKYWAGMDDAIAADNPGGSPGGGVTDPLEIGAVEASDYVSVGGARVPALYGPINFKFSDAPNDGDIFTLFELQAGDFIYDIMWWIKTLWDDTGGTPSANMGVDLGGPNEFNFELPNQSPLRHSSGRLFGTNPLVSPELSLGWVQGLDVGVIFLADNALQIKYIANGGPDPALQGELNLWLLLVRGVTLPA